MKGSCGGGSFCFSSESVSMGHPDKVADQISDAILDSLLEHDPEARVAVETLVTTGLIVLAGEVTVHNQAAEKALSNVEDTARRTVREIGYDDPTTGFDYRSCAVLRALHSQSADISRGVTGDSAMQKEQGAGDQGLMFGYACDETSGLMPMPIHLARQILARITELREKGVIKWLRPDAKSQVSVEYQDDQPVGLRAIVLSTQHTEEALDAPNNPEAHMSEGARRTLIQEVIRPVVQRECPSLWSDDIEFHINPTGRFIIGGPHGDAGLTGRKIIVDTYGGWGRHGGGAFSGKDASKVDRSAAYMARHIAKNVVAAKLARRCEIQLAYAIGVAEPVSIRVDTFGTSDIPDETLTEVIRTVFRPLTPRGIIEYLKLKRPIYLSTARYGHFGRTGAGLTWEETNRVGDLQRAVKGLVART
ncbi:MAG: S-adenosylmethionine synthase [Phycisphaerae bacterium]|nr:S-adenosylmethionine synthase [Phycisphaerae bacterium]